MHTPRLKMTYPFNVEEVIDTTLKVILNDSWEAGPLNPATGSIWAQ